MKFKNVLITGGAGYVGSALVPRLLDKGHNVMVYDLYLYGDVFKNLKDKSKLKEIKADIRDKKRLLEATNGMDAVIHLACISNDPSFELDPKLGKSINLDAFYNILEAAEKNKVKRLIYASTSSVYGIKEMENVTEDETPEPITDYSKYKYECEKILSDWDSETEKVVIRPATVCGYAPRLRLDVVVNILTINALINKKIKIFGGPQLRPNINIKDMVRVYELLLEAPSEKINWKTFNAGFQNYSVEKIANIVKDTIGDKSIVLEKVPTDDIRSYHISSEKIKKELGFEAKHTVEDAVQSLADAYKKGLIVDAMDNPLYYNIEMMQKIGLK